jgi:ATP-dependent Zn protease
MNENDLKNQQLELSTFRKTLREIDWFLRSKRPIIYLTTPEEQRIEDGIRQICAKPDHKWDLITWDLVSGLQSTNSSFLPVKESDRLLDQLEVLTWFDNLEVPKGNFLLLVLKDFSKYFGNQHTQGQIEYRLIRHIKNIAQKCVTKNKALIVISQSFDLPNELDKYISVIDIPLPEKEHIELKIKDLLDKASQRKDLAEKFKTNYSSEELEHIVNSFRGLTLNECEQVCTYCMIKHTCLDPEAISHQKKDIIRKSGLLDWIDVSENLENIGGLNELKDWLYKRTKAFTKEAVDYGLPPNPKGILLVGIQGAGKSLFARGVSSFWNFPLLKLDMGKVFSGIVGSSENNMRQVFKVAESVAPCILWLDEIDKGMSGSRSSSVSDGGTTSRVLGSWLTWMQENQSPVFIVATANDISNLPPELMRKGRFDEIFFVDLPSSAEREVIFNIHLNKRNRDINKFDLSLLAEESHNFTGAEIEAAIVSAMYEAFNQSREFNTDDIVESLNEIVPLSVTMKEEIESLKLWASERARNASNSGKLKKYMISRIPKVEEDL